ncbi:membrane protein [Streptococcus suis]|uniref:Membrane protein n=1 Tax=Streptococcus suis TaxID=1307 RepID=A0A116M3K0_STRSU|nr:membrane protein [Streptococcus suis]
MTVVDGQLKSQNSMLLVLSLALGTLIGEVLHIEGWFERLGIWLREKSGNGQDSQFLDAFLTASLTVCIGAMAIIGSIQDGLTGDYTLLAIKSILDFIIIFIMTASLGKGAGFSAVPVFLFQGSVTLLARLIEPLMTDQALANLSFIGSALIFCVGVNIIWDKKIRVANMLPAIVIAVIWSFF